MNYNGEEIISSPFWLSAQNHFHMAPKLGRIKITSSPSRIGALKPPINFAERPLTKTPDLNTN